MKIIFTCLLATLIYAPAFARPHYVQPDSIPAKKNDVASIDSILKALYDVISGGKGVTRNWDRMRTLFKPEAMMVPTGRKKDSTPHSNVIAVEDYIKLIGPNLEKVGFFETEIGRKTDRYGNIAQVFSAYESRNALTDAKPFMRGINSIQLWFDGKRWWILSVFWQGETPDNPIPKEYLF
jgi:hypothetical protein